MKIFFTSILILLFSIFLFSETTSYDVEKIYSVQLLEPGTIGITTFGQAEEIVKILKPMTLDPGRYSVYIKRVDSDLYEIVGKNIYIKTRYCYEYTYGEQAILEISSSYSYSIGKLHFQ